MGHESHKPRVYAETLYFSATNTAYDHEARAFVDGVISKFVAEGKVMPDSLGDLSDLLRTTVIEFQKKQRLRFDELPEAVQARYNSQAAQINREHGYPEDAVLTNNQQVYNEEQSQ